jgi:hypothetical protein
MASSQLRKCPTCEQPWPDDEENALRGFGWLDPLPRGITVSNIDGIIHDGAGPQDRFLALESKKPGEPLRSGQERLLRAFAALPGVTVRLLRRRTDGGVTKIPVVPSGLGSGVSLTLAEARAGIVRWIDPAFPIPTLTNAPRSASTFIPDANFLAAWDEIERKRKSA